MVKDKYEIEYEIRKEYNLKDQEHKNRYFCFARIKTLLIILLIFGVGTIIYCWEDIKFYISANFEAIIVLFAIIIAMVSLGLLFFPLDYFYKKKKCKEVED